MNLKIMTFNTQHCKNYITKKIDYNSIVRLIDKYNIDIIGLNEMYFGQTNKIAHKLKFNYYFGKSTYILLLPYGNAIISRYPIIDTKIIKIPNSKRKTGKNHYEKRTILYVKILVNNKVLNVYVTHLGLNNDEQINGINELIKNVENDKSIIMGDFNISNNNNILNPIRNKFNDSLKENLFTWPSNKPYIRYDYIFTSKDIKIISSNVLDDIVSDHKSVFAEIKF